MKKDLSIAQISIMKNKRRRLLIQGVKFLLIITVAFFMLYPLLWMLGASFNDGLMSSFSFIPKKFTTLGWEDALKAPGWGSVQGYSLLRALSNTLQYVLPQVLIMTFSTLIVAFVIARMRFKGKKIVFALIIATLLMPSTIFRIPMFVFWTSKVMSPLWEGSQLPLMPYLPLWAGSLFAINSFSIFMYIQFMRTIPKDLDEAAYIDGASKFQVLYYVLMPVLKPILITVALLLFIASFNDYQGPLIYRGDVETYPLSLVLPMLGKDSTNTYAHVFSRSIVGVMLPIIIFFMAQKFFVGNEADSGIKG
ncbi:MAG: carbohydrate ABC transporter permease [Candidatus Izemoplasmatales bacterium]|nr:carbohydrate ABC transporter permease [Candidatus Izemoplasmatales bacterium]